MRSVGAKKDPHADTPRARLLERFHLAKPHQSGEFVTFTDHCFGFRSSCAQSAFDHIPASCCMPVLLSAEEIGVTVDITSQSRPQSSGRA